MNPTIASRSARRVRRLVSKIVDNFERGDLNPYTGSTSSFTLTDAPTKEGNYALESGNYDEIISTSGLPNYPTQSAETKYVVNIYMDGGTPQFMFGVQGSDNLYLLRPGPDIGFLKKSDGGFSTIRENKDLASAPSQEWLRVELEWETSGLMTATVYDEQGVCVGVGIVKDTDYTGGGIGWRGTDPVYYDNARIEDVDSTPGVINQNGAWTFFGSPELVARNGVIYGGYIDSNGVVAAIESDVDAGTKREQNLGRSPNAVDDHAKPTVLIRNSDDHLVYFWDRKSIIYYRISDNPLSTEGFGPVQKVGSSNDYATPVQLSAESDTIYLFHRYDYTKLSYHTSTDGASSWSSRQDLIEHSSGSGRSYFQTVGEGTDTIHVAWNDTSNTDSLYYFKYQSDEFFTADGTSIGTKSDLPFTEADPELVYDSTASGNSDTWVWDIAHDNGDPIIVFVTFPGDHVYQYARWNGSSWDINEVATTPGSIYETDGQPRYSPGIHLDHANPSRVYYSKEVATDQFEVFVAETADGGATWSHTQITKNSATDNSEKNVRPVDIRNRTAEPRFAWMRGRYTTFDDYDTRIVTTDTHDDR